MVSNVFICKIGNLKTCQPKNQLNKAANLRYPIITQSFGWPCTTGYQVITSYNLKTYRPTLLMWWMKQGFKKRGCGAKQWRGRICI